MHGGDIQVRFNIAVGGDELSDLKALSTVQFLTIELPSDVGSGVSRGNTLEAQGRSGSKGLFTEAVTDLWWFD